MKIVDSLKNHYSKRAESVVPRVRICVECGSSDINIHGKYLVCNECKTAKHYKIKSSRFFPGQLVRIVEKEVDADIIYKVKKIKKSKEGLILYVLKPETKGKEILYYEGKDADLQQVIESRTIKKKSRFSRN